MRFGIAGSACVGLSILLLAGCSGSGSESGTDSPDGVTGPRTGVWLSGDLHLHSDHSTDAADNPMTALIDEADTVMLFAGAGVRGAREEVLALAERVKAPIGHAFGGKEWMQYDNPYDVGMSGLLGYGACYEAMHEADLVILLGTDFPYSEFLPRENGKGAPRIVQIDADASRLGRRVGLDLAVHGDVALTLQAVLPLLTSTKGHRYLHRQLKAHHKALSGVVAAYTKNVERMTPIHPEFVAATLDDRADDAEDALAALRGEIDALDDALHDLVMRRAEVVARLASTAVARARSHPAVPSSATSRRSSGRSKRMQPEDSARSGRPNRCRSGVSCMKMSSVLGMVNLIRPSAFAAPASWRPTAR